VLVNTTACIQYLCFTVNDLLAWHALLEPSGPVEVSPLEALAERPLSVRAAFLPLLDPHFSDPRAEIRALACRVSAGASGHDVLVHLARALDDVEAVVRSAAILALRESCSDDPWRFAHALFHRDVTVRAGALAALPDALRNTGASLCLACDPQNREAALGALPRRLDTSAVSLLGRLVADVNDVARLGLVPAMRALPWDDPAAIVQAGSPAVEAFLAACWPGAPTAAWGTGDDPWASLERNVRAPLRDPLVDIARAVRRVAALRPEWPVRVVALVASVDPTVLADASIPVDLRRAALRRLGTRPRACAVRKLAKGGPALDFMPEPSLLGDPPDLEVLLGSLSLTTASAAFAAAYPAIPGLVDTAAAQPVAAATLVSRVVAWDAPSKDELRPVAEFVAEVFARLARRREDAAAFALALSPECSACLPLHEVDVVRLARAVVGELAKRGADRDPERDPMIGVLLGRLALHEAPGSAHVLDLLGGAGAVLGSRVVETALGVIEDADPEGFAARLWPVDPDALLGLLAVLEHGDAVGLATLYRLAGRLSGHADPGIRAWAADVMPATIDPRDVLAAPPRVPMAIQAIEPTPIDDATSERLARGPAREMPDALAVFLRGPHTGLAAALKGRSAFPLAEAGAALLACHDGPETIAALFDRWSGPLEAVEETLLASARGMRWLPTLAHLALLSADGVHIDCPLDALVAQPDALPELLKHTLAWPSAALRAIVWNAAPKIAAYLRWRRRQRFLALDLAPLCNWLGRVVVADAVSELHPRCVAAAAELDVLQERAAATLSEIYKGLLHERCGTRVLDTLLPTVSVSLPFRSRETREAIGGWIPSAAAARDAAERPAVTVVAPRPSSDGVDTLCRTVLTGSTASAASAARELVAMGPAGRGALLATLIGEQSPFAIDAAAAVLLSSEPSADEVTTLLVRVDDTAVAPRQRWRLGLVLLEHGHRAAIRALLAAACVPTDENWFRPTDWPRLLAAGVAPEDAACALAGSNQPVAAVNAALVLLEPACRAEAGARADALRRFLRTGIGELRLRVSAAAALAATVGDWVGLPVLIEGFLDDPAAMPSLDGMPAGADELFVRAVMASGNTRAEHALATRLASGDWPTTDRVGECLALLIARTRERASLQAVAACLRRRRGGEGKLQEVAELFAWGVRRALVLSGRRLRVEASDGESLGHTDTRDDRIHVTPLAVFSGEPQARPITRGLILHEIGHQLYDRGPGPWEVWEEAQREGLRNLLNLLQDERLERRLRARDPAMGDDLKTLAAWAFLHREQELAVWPLLLGLGWRSFPVLSRVTLAPAFGRGCVKVGRGRLLRELERQGLAISRFIRALRLGLGNRHGDPTVSIALRLCRGLRQASSRELLEIARKLRDLFGAEVTLFELFSSHGGLAGDPLESARQAEGVSSEDIEGRVERILRRPERTSDGERGVGALQINVGPDPLFPPIDQVVRVPFDAAAHQTLAVQVAAPARVLRRHLEALGLRRERVRAQLRGHRIDPARLVPAILRSDPRLLVRRRLRRLTDLWLGVIVDCSGSMAVHESMVRARLFATLVALAVRDLRGVDAHFFGFTDEVIYDAGHARRCAVAALEANGGNNDAGALAFVAAQARRSRRSSRLLVMISDGLPTECSVAALRSLVAQLGRQRIACAQVAVRSLEEVCFPHFVEISGGDLDGAVRRFGRTLERLVRATVGGE